MLKRPNRLTDKFQFNVTRKYGKKLQYDCFNVYYLVPKNYTGRSKLGIVVSNKISNLATKRNRIKRVLRELLRPLVPTLPENLWIAVYAGPKILNINHEKIIFEVNKAIQEISLSH